MRKFVCILIVLALIAMSGCVGVKGAVAKFNSLVDKAEQTYDGQRNIYIAQRETVAELLAVLKAASPLLPANVREKVKEVEDKATKLDAVMLKADNNIRKFWKNEVLRQGQNLNRTVAILDTTIAILQTYKAITGK